MEERKIIEELYKFKHLFMRELKETIKPLVDAINENTKALTTPKQLSLDDFGVKVEEVKPEELPFSDLVKQPEEAKEEIPAVEIDVNGDYIEHCLNRLADYDRYHPGFIRDGIISVMTSDKTNYINPRGGKYIVRMRMQNFEFCGKVCETYEDAIAFRDRLVANMSPLAYQNRDILNKVLMYQGCCYGKAFINRWLKLLHHTDAKLEEKNNAI